MKKGFAGEWGILLVFLLMASFSASIVSGENNSLDGNILNLYNLTPKTLYNIIIKTGNETLNTNYTSESDGKLAILLGNLTPPTIQFFVNEKNNLILNGTLQNTQATALSTSEVKKGESSPTKESPSSTAIPILTTTAATPVDTQNIKSIPEKDNLTFFLMAGLILIVLLVILYIHKLKQSDNEPNSKLNKQSQLHSNFYKLKVELIDESGMRLSDKIVKAFTKNVPVPQGSARSDIYGECTLELLKGKYSINVEGGEKYESVPKEINLKGDENIQMILARRQPLQIELVDKSGNPLKGLKVRVLELPSYVDIISPIETDNNGFAKFYISKNKQYVTSVQLTDEYIKQEKIPINNSEEIKRIQILRKMGTLEVTVAEQTTGKTFAGIPVTVTKKGTSSTNEFLTDESGKINQKIPVGDYIIRLKPGSFPLYESSEKYIAVIENRMSKIIIDFKFNIQTKNQDIQLINTIKEKLETSYKEVSAYDACIPLFFKRVGEKPTKLVENITKRPIEFLGAKTSPDEIIPHILKTAEFISGEISRIMREKSNVDFYYSIQNLDPVNDLNVSDYSQEKFRELVHDIENYHKNHKTEIGNKLHEIDAELTQLSGDLTIQPVADLWRVAQKLQENSLNESDIKKRGVMLFLNDKLLDHVREMYNKEEVKSRLKFSMV